MPTQALSLNRGDVFRHHMAGGGGYGNAHERDPERVRADLLDGKVTRAHARDVYGVVFSDDARCAVDAAATSALRGAQA